MDQINSYLKNYEETRHKSILLFEDVQLILTELGFLHSGGRQAMKKDPSIDIYKERDLLDDLWMHLKGEEYGTVTNLKTFLYGVLGLKYTWMIAPAAIDLYDIHNYKTHDDRVTSKGRISESTKNQLPNELTQSTAKSGSSKEDSAKGFHTLNLFGSTSLGNNGSGALQPLDSQNPTKGNNTPTQESISTQLGENVGTFNTNGKFLFTKKVEIRKVNLHYKLLADNRAKFVRKKKLKSSPKKLEERIQKTKKVDHKKYLKKQPKNYEPKIVNFSATQQYDKNMEENQGQSLEEAMKDFKAMKAQQKANDVDGSFGDNDGMTSQESESQLSKRSCKYSASKYHSNKDRVKHNLNRDIQYSEKAKPEIQQDLAHDTTFNPKNQIYQPSNKIENIQNAVESSKNDNLQVSPGGHETDSEKTPQEVRAPQMQLKPEFVPPNKHSSQISVPDGNQTASEAGPLPYLYVDVNITDTEMSTIEVFDGDKAETLAKNFAEKHGLDDKTEKKLIDMLKAQMATVLCKIEEEDNETNEDEDTE